MIVGQLQLDRRKAGVGCRSESLEQRALGEKVCEIGGKAGHGKFRALERTMAEPINLDWDKDGFAFGSTHPTIRMKSSHARQ
jgi:hypothetical protein